jgi:acyl-coenzyme A thioesterase PaaI-like protein
MRSEWHPEHDGWRVHDSKGFIGLVGPIWEIACEDGPRFCFQASSKHENLRGVVQGGMLMTFLDRLMGATGRWHNGNRPQATVQLDVRFIRAVHIGSIVMGSAKIVRRTKSLVFLDGQLTVEEEVVATGNGIWKMLGT